MGSRYANWKGGWNVLSTFLSILAALVLLSLLVTIHELGHYLAGRKLGFTIVEFAVGMGPVLLKTTRNGIQYSLRALPIGGMCRFFGEDEEAQDARCFNAQKVWKRIVVVLAGPIMNLLFAVLCAVVTISIFGDYMPSVYEIPDTTSPAYIGGMQAGDVITEVNGKRVLFYSDTVSMIQAVDADEMLLKVDRGGEKTTLTLRDFYSEADGKNRIGITITPVRYRFGFGETLAHSVGYITGTIRETFGFFGRLFQGNVASNEVSGPVGIVAYISEAVRSSGETVLRLAVLISASLGVMNLLPFPALDGGRLVFMLVEAVRGKPISAQKEGLVHLIGLVLLFGLIIFLTYNDITNLIRG